MIVRIIHLVKTDHKEKGIEKDKDFGEILNVVREKQINLSIYRTIEHKFNKE